MNKKRTNISLDPDVLEKARDLGINISQTSEQALKQRITRLQNHTQRDDSLTQSSMLAGEQTETPSLSTVRTSRKEPDEFLDDFEQTCRVDWDLADSTTTERMRYAEKLVDHLDGHPLTTSKQQLRDFISQFDDQNAIKTVRVIYGRYFDTDIADSFKVQPTPPKPKKVPEKSELKQVYHALDCEPDQVAFLILATSGLRRRELIELTPDDLKPTTQAIYPSTEDGKTTKRQWITYYNDETDSRLRRVFDLDNLDGDESVFECSGPTLTRHFREASTEAGTMKITPQVLRIWFCNEMNRLGVADRYIDAFCGRTPKSVLAKHYSDYTPRKLQEVYESAELTVLN